MEIVLLSGRKSEKLTGTVYQRLLSKKEFNLRKVDVAVDNFKNGELNIKLLESVRGDEVIIFQQFTQPGNILHEELFEMFLLLDTVSRSAANSITLCVPFLPYLRQDRKAEGREPISAKVLLNLLDKSASGKLTRIITFDMHNEAEQGFIDLPIDNIPAISLLTAEILQQKWFDREHTVVLAPDVGSAKKAEKLASYLKLENDAAIVNKKRKKGERAVAKSIIGDVFGKNVLIVDDMIDSGGTIMGAVQLARENGAKEVLVAATHGIFSANALDEFLDAEIKTVVTDTIPRENKFTENSWLTVVPVADYLSEIISANMLGESVHEIIEKSNFNGVV